MPEIFKAAEKKQDRLSHEKIIEEERCHFIKLSTIKKTLK